MPPVTNDLGSRTRLRRTPRAGGRRRGRARTRRADRRRRPDLEYLAGYAAPALERLTALIVRPGAAPALVVPELERPRALEAPGAGLVEMVSWVDGDDPYERAASCSGPRPRASRRGTSCGRRTCSRCRSCCRRRRSRWPRPVLAELRAVKDAGEIALLSRAGGGRRRGVRRHRLGGARRQDRAGRRGLAGPAPGRTGTRDGRLHDRRLGPQRRLAAPRAGRPHDRGRGRRRPRLRRQARRVLLGHDPDGRRWASRRRRSGGARHRPRGPAGGVRGRRARGRRGGGRPRGAGRDRTRGYGAGLRPPDRPRDRVGRARGARTWSPATTVPWCPATASRSSPASTSRARFGVRIEDIVAITDDGPRRLNEATPRSPDRGLTT